MAKISTYPQPTPPQLSDYVIGTDISDLLMTKNFLLSDIITLATTTNQFVTIAGAAQTITGSKTFDYGTTTGVYAPVIINLPAQTQTISPDALLININGQVPTSTPGYIAGVNVQAHLLDNVAYYADLLGDSGNSRGLVVTSVDSHSGNFLEFRKSITSPSSDTLLFYVNPNGQAVLNSANGMGIGLQVNGGNTIADIGIQGGAYAGVAVYGATYGGVGIQGTSSAAGGVAVKALGNNGAIGLYLKSSLSIEGNEGTVGNILKSNGPGVSPSWITESKGYFYNTATQTFTTVNVGVPITLPTTNPQNTSGISVVTDGTALNRITFTSSGSYRISVNLSTVNSGPVSTQVYVWLRKNGTDIAATTRIMSTISGLIYQNFSLDYAVSITASDYIQVMCSSANTSILISGDAATVDRPASPSSVVTINSI